MTHYSDERGAELRELFFESAIELLQSLDDEAMKLEKRPDDVETVRSIRRIVHTLKGDSAACGFRELSELAHELEDALAVESATCHISLAEIAFTAADTFGAMIASYRRKVKLPSGEPLRKMVCQLAQDPKVPKSRKKAKALSMGAVVWTEYEKLAAQSALNQGKQVYHISAHIDPHCAMPIAARHMVLNAIASAGEVLAIRPEAGSPDSTKRLELLFAGSKPAEYLLTKCRIPTVISHVDLAPLEGPAQAAQEPKPESPRPARGVANLAMGGVAAKGRGAPQEPEAVTKAATVNPGNENVLRVDAERIDNVLNLVGELIIGKSMLQQALNEFARHYPKEAMRGRFADAMAFQARVLNDLQRSVMKVRMVPVEQLFRRFPRMVRDVAKQCGKEVELVISGQDTDLDKSLLDAIAEPLTHLVRNSVSHGIEDAAERTRLGKPACGTIRLSAYHHGNQVVVEVGDDGRGIDTEKVKAKAIAQGILNSEQAARLSEEDILELVFRPSFSTAEQITEVSGRGVGLDVVRSVLHRMKGTVDVETRPGRGAAFRLKLPLTLAIIKALLFRVEQRLYAIPLNAVAEIARGHESDLHRVDSYEVIQLRNQVLPLVRLGRPPAEQAAPQDAKIFVLVITVGERKLGLIVEALEGEEELVIKALDDQTVATDLASGASILGDGRVVLILNLAAVVERFAKSRPEQSGGLSCGFLRSHTERAKFADSAREVRP